MSGSSYNRPQQQGRRRNRYLFLLLLPLAFLLGGVSFTALRANPPAPTPINIAAGSPSAAATESAAATSSEDPATPTPSPRATEAVAAVSAAPTSAFSVGPDPSTVYLVGDSPPFSISGGVQNLLPGMPKTIRLTLTNPSIFPLYVTSLTVRLPADSTPTGCKPADNVQVTQSNASVASPIVIPARGSISVTDAPRAPQVTLINLPSVNQDVCKGKSFMLSFIGSAHS